MQWLGVDSYNGPVEIAQTNGRRTLQTRALLRPVTKKAAQIGGARRWPAHRSFRNFSPVSLPRRRTAHWPKRRERKPGTPEYLPALNLGNRPKEPPGFLPEPTGLKSTLPKCACLARPVFRRIWRDRWQSCRVGSCQLRRLCPVTRQDHAPSSYTAAARGNTNRNRSRRRFKHHQATDSKGSALSGVASSGGPSPDGRRPSPCLRTSEWMNPSFVTTVGVRMNG